MFVSDIEKVDFKWKLEILGSSRRHVNLVTVRSPVPPRYTRMLNSISKIGQVRLITGTTLPTIYLRMKINTALGFAVLIGKYLKSVGPTLMDNVALHSSFVRGKRGLVVDFRVPFPIELAWLGHRSFAKLAQATGRALRNVELVFAANEKMGLMCKELGANSVYVFPNYPSRSFRPTVKPEGWRSQHGLDIETHVALFTGEVRLKEIYGLDFLLESWRLVENLDPSAVLVILGADSIQYARERIRSLDIRQCLLPGRVDLTSVANWVNCSDVCLAPRTPGFPRSLYDDKDSTKISEYAALEKPIVAAGYAPSSQYTLFAQNPEDFAEGIMQGFDGKISTPKPHYWEENEESMLRLLEDFWFT